jgi:hypothetical protein
MILERIEDADGSIQFVSPDGEHKLSGIHQPAPDCYQHGCVIHSPSQNWSLANAPYNWRTDRGIMERLCEHGVGHPDIDSADYNTRIGRSFENSHGCCGCCAG